MRRRVVGADAECRSDREGSGRTTSTRRGFQAAYQSVLLPGIGPGSSRDPGRSQEADRPRNRNRSAGPAAGGRGGRLRGHAPARLAVDAELPAAGGGRAHRPAGPPQAWFQRHPRRMAVRRRVRRQGRESRHRSMRAWRAHVLSLEFRPFRVRLGRDRAAATRHAAPGDRRSVPRHRYLDHGVVGESRGAGSGGPRAAPGGSAARCRSGGTSVRRRAEEPEEHGTEPAAATAPSKATPTGSTVPPPLRSSDQSAPAAGPLSRQPQRL